LALALAFGGSGSAAAAPAGSAKNTAATSDSNNESAADTGDPEEAVPEAEAETAPDVFEDLPEPTVPSRRPSQNPDLMPGRASHQRSWPRALMFTGWGTLSSVWLFSALLGASLMGNQASGATANCTNCASVGPLMLIPVAGPFIALPNAGGGDDMALAAILGGLQVVGLAAGIVGTVFYLLDRNTKPRQAANTTTDDSTEWHVSWTVLPGPRGRGAVSLHVGF
jgi:hypothetical protein